MGMDTMNKASATVVLCCAILSACDATPACTSGATAVVVDGGTLCVTIARDASVCPPGQTLSVTDAGLECRPAPPSGPAEARAAGVIDYLPVIMAPDGTHLAIVDRIELFRHDWVQPAYALQIDGDTLTLFDSNIGCPVNPDAPPPEAGRMEWWAINTTTVQFTSGHLGVVSGPTCVPGTSPAPRSVLFASAAEGVRGCWLGHNPYLDVHCGAFQSGTGGWTWEESLLVPRPRRSWSVGMPTTGFAVVEALDQGNYPRTLHWLDDGAHERASSALLPGVTDVDGQPQMLIDQWIAGVGDDTWIGSMSGDGSLLIERRRSSGDLLAPLWVPAPSTDAMIVSASAIAGAPGTGSLFVSGTGTEATLELLSIDDSGRGTATALQVAPALLASGAMMQEELVVAVTDGARLLLIRASASGELRETLELTGTLPAPQLAALAIDPTNHRIFVATLSLVDTMANTYAAELISIERR